MTAATVARGDMPLGSHVSEARRRAVRAAVALTIGMIAGFVFSDQVIDVLRAPIEVLAESRDASLNYDSVTGAFELKLKIALFAGVVLSSPIWIFELFGFVSPGLTRRERRLTVGFSFAALALFATGSVTGFLLFPHMVELLASFASAEDSTILNAAYYVDFVMKIVVATGIAFTLPVFMVLLNALGLVSARTLLRSWRLIVVAIVVFSALVTPAADVLSMFLIAVPMAALFAGALLITHLHDRRAARRASAAGLPDPVATPSGV
ncbi:twin-arginine translocase subunit TatC [Microbacterium invictum]|uniref:Sec-independent protein translocase protein TatC n=1 Tax=Microbacterium invictum TaxID=515415 RepID=A0ABZ0VBE0_9MICO|nr:twin-arginine translocase subunit TatC [Microbacterium invictum]WQB70539.1 twin-arginine translocase subunit TatC [Microbacterium invictum]